MAASIREESYKKTNVATTRSTFSRHMGAKVLFENNETLSLKDIQNNEIAPFLVESPALMTLHPSPQYCEREG
jgi:hypothetical protein